MPKYTASITYGKVTDIIWFDTAREFWNQIAPHLEEGFEVTVKKEKEYFAGRIK